MSREIKFRGKRLDTKEWVYGSLIDYKDGDYAITVQHHVPTYVPVLPETVGQYTGLKDKNGVEIYEGDVIEYDAFYDEFNMPGGTGYWEWRRVKSIVSFEDGFFTGDECIPLAHVEDYSGYYAHEQHPFPDDYESGLKVIGNIHENHELI